MYDEILLPTDGSPGMASAIEQCFYQAERSGATVHALYVVDVRAYVMLPDETQQHVAELLESEGKEAVAEVERLAEERDIPVVGSLYEGVPHDVILSYAAENDVDLIVMGTHGRTGEQQRVVGSVAEEVVRNATVPVLTVHMSAADLEAEGETTVPEAQRRYIE